MNVFDIDEALVNTFSKIKVRKGSKIVRELDNRAFNTYILKKGESYDFAEFRNAQVFRDTARPIHNMITMAKSVITDQSPVCKTILLTARGDFDDRDTFLQTFRDHNFPIDLVHVERAGNLAGRYNATPNVSKLAVIRKYIASGRFNKVRVWDDSEKNLQTIVKLVHFHPEIEVEAWLVKHDGTTTKY